MKKQNNQKKRGFTLIELLVVIAIIGLLSSIILASLNSAKKKAQEARILTDLHQLQNALELYKNTTGHYPQEGVTYESSPNIGTENADFKTALNDLVQKHAISEILTPPTGFNPGLYYDYITDDFSNWGQEYVSCNGVIVKSYLISVYAPKTMLKNIPSFAMLLEGGVLVRKDMTDPDPLNPYGAGCVGM